MSIVSSFLKKSLLLLVDPLNWTLHRRVYWHLREDLLDTCDGWPGPVLSKRAQLQPDWLPGGPGHQLERVPAKRLCQEVDEQSALTEVQPCRSTILHLQVFPLCPSASPPPNDQLVWPDRGVITNRLLSVLPEIDVFELELMWKDVSCFLWEGKDPSL